MQERNKAYMFHLQESDVPWHRLTTAYERATDFPDAFDTLRKMDDLEHTKEALFEITYNIEHQSTLWQATPFAMIFLVRILKQALEESEHNDVAHWLVNSILDFLDDVIVSCEYAEQTEHTDQLPLFSDMLKEEYLPSADYDEAEDEMLYEEFLEDIYYSFYYYSNQVILAYRTILEQAAPKEFGAKIAEIYEKISQIETK